MCRRYSGGGAVYQDLGNFCFSFITPVFDKDYPPLNMKEIHNDILIDGFKKMNIPVQSQGRNDMVLEEKKFSGSAFEVDLGSKKRQKRVLHHGTILLNADLKIMTHLLNPNVMKLKSKGINSVKARVMNLHDKYPDIDFDTIIKNVQDSFFDKFGDINCEKSLTYLDEDSFNQNKEVMEYYKKLKDQNWILGESPFFTNNFETRFDWGVVDLHLEVKKGLIEKAILYSDSLHPQFIDNINAILNSNKFKYNSEDMKVLEEKINETTDDPILLKYSKEFCDWVGTCIKG